MGHFEKHGVVPDLIDAAPHSVVQVEYAPGIVVNHGNELTPRQVKDQPTVTWAAKNDKFYTLSMTDPDAPSRENPEFGPINHWLVVNIPGDNISEGQVLTTYRGSRPRTNTGLHRYVFLVYEQQGQIEPNKDNFQGDELTIRRKFSIRKFAKEMQLGEPVAGNFYLAQFDDYVASIV